LPSPLLGEDHRETGKFYLKNPYGPLREKEGVRPKDHTGGGRGGDGDAN